MPEPLTPLLIDDAGGLAAMGARIRAELRSDEELWMRVAAQRWAHARRVGDVLREYAARGDRVAIDVAGRAFEGPLLAVGDDRVDLSTSGGVVSIRTAFGEPPAVASTPLIVRRSRRARSGGHRLPAALVTFRARLLELEDPPRDVRVGVWPSATEHVGPIVVGRDHVIVSGDADVLVSAPWIAYVVEDAGVAR